jgi:hypothetical protein
MVAAWAPFDRLSDACVTTRWGAGRQMLSMPRSQSLTTLWMRNPAARGEPPAATCLIQAAVASAIRRTSGAPLITVQLSGCVSCPEGACCAIPIIAAMISRGRGSPEIASGGPDRWRFRRGKIRHAVVVAASLPPAARRSWSRHGAI